MNCPRRVLALLFCGLPLVPVFLSGQIPAGAEPEVRRAIPVEPPMAPAVAVLPAATPSPTPEGPRTAPAVPFDAPIPAPPPGSAAAQGEPADPGIRMAPGAGVSMTPEQAQFESANRQYARKAFEFAASEYEAYLQMFRAGAYRQAALFRLGECFRAMGNTNNARQIYERLLAEFQTGEFVGPTAYRLAEMYFSTANYRAALPLYETASRRLTDPAVRLACTYREARCLELLDRPESARAAYRAVLAEKGDNPYRDASLLSMAGISEKTDRPREALEAYVSLANSGNKPALRCEAAVKGGVVAAKLGNTDRARSLYSMALGFKEAGAWAGLARLGLLRLSYEEGDYQKVLDAFGETVDAFPEDARAEALLIAANTRRQLGKHTEAGADYDAIITRYPGSPQAEEAAFQRLVSLYSLGGTDIPTRIDEFLAGNPPARQADQARLLKAEYFYKEGQFGPAADVYETLPESSLSAPFKADALFKLGWCRGQTGQNDKAIAAFTAFLDKHSVHPLAASALARRGLASQQSGDFASALADFSTVIEKHPKAKEREIALQQKALILGQRKDNAGMADTFARLLADYPKSAAAAQANYWIGWVRFEDKKYRDAVPPLTKARTADEAGYFDRATLRITLALYYLEDRDACAREADLYLSRKTPIALPSDILHWLGAEYLGAGQYAAAGKYLTVLAERENPSPPPEDTWLLLGRARIGLSQWEDAFAALKTYLGKAQSPQDQASGYLVLAQAQIEAGRFGDAEASVETLLRLRPEGRLNAEGRLLNGEILFARGRYEDAAKAFLSVSVLHDDPKITPRAIERAVAAYTKSGDTAEAAKLFNQLRTRFPEYKFSVVAP